MQACMNKNTIYEPTEPSPDSYISADDFNQRISEIIERSNLFYNAYQIGRKWNIRWRIARCCFDTIIVLFIILIYVDNLVYNAHFYVVFGLGAAHSNTSYNFMVVAIFVYFGVSLLLLMFIIQSDMPYECLRESTRYKLLVEALRTDPKAKLKVQYWEYTNTLAMSAFEIKFENTYIYKWAKQNKNTLFL